MYDTILGTDGFRKGIDLYFERHDGSAVTCDDFLTAMADANGEDLTNLGKWYVIVIIVCMRVRHSLALYL